MRSDRLVVYQISSMLLLTLALSIFDQIAFFHWTIASIMSYLILYALIFPEGAKSKSAMRAKYVAYILSGLGFILTGWYLVSTFG